MPENIWIGIDIGGTKISVGVVAESGQILARVKQPTPRTANHAEFIKFLIQFIHQALQTKKYFLKNVLGVGLGVPGIVNPKDGFVIATPNASLSGCALGKALQQKLRVPVAVGNDVNLGLLGEKWLGAAKGLQNVVGIFPGTGLGGGVVVDGKLLIGHQGAAAEIGHMTIDPHGPMCTCGNQGCLEAFVGRWAITRDVAEALRRGEKSLLTKLTDGKISNLKSSHLADALKKKDPLTTRLLNQVANDLGIGCKSLRHIFDPQEIVLGGGLIEAFGGFLLPRIQKVLNNDPFFKNLPPCPIVASQLLDDAVVLGAVACIMQARGRSLTARSLYPFLEMTAPGGIRVHRQIFKNDFSIRADGKIKKRKLSSNGKPPRSLRLVDVSELKKLCKKKPQVLIIGAKSSRCLQLSKEAKAFCQQEGIEVNVLPTSKAVQAYNTTHRRKAFLLHFNCP
ncbi:MAG: ROK family protein [Candidatus Omnitrophica bacterium]|nr:ROK family protein [Candidatus Omnitrophota bacterium]